LMILEVFSNLNGSMILTLLLPFSAFKGLRLSFFTLKARN